MNKRILRKLLTILFTGTLIILFLSSNILSITGNLKIDNPDFMIRGICTVLAMLCLVISLELKIKYLNIGWGLLTISLLTDMLDEIEAISFWRWVDYVFEDAFLGLGILLIGYGFYKVVEKKEALKGKLRRMAFKDPLTDLPNRRIIKQHLLSAIREASKNNRKAGILLINLDKFKLVNDTLGHNIGSNLLKKAANRLRSILRKEDTIAHLGGDEFIIILNDIEYLEEIEYIAQRSIALFKVPFMLIEKSIHSTCSIGVSVFPEGGEDAETLFKNAEIAMYMSKEKGPNSYQFYTEVMKEKAGERLEKAENIREALARGEFTLHYQPKVRVETGEITGVEALVRWNHPRLGLVYPNYFISIAEETGLIKEIDQYVLKLACLQIREWTNQGFEPINITVNISAALFNSSDFICNLDAILHSTGVDISYLSIEVTETATMEDMEYAYDIFDKLKKKGIKISLDDFGTGYSSLSYLKTFPIDALKIDKAFIDGITKDKRDESLIKAAITMAKPLNIKVISEGVETIEQLEFLNNVGCDEYQGYLFSEPMPIEAIEDLLIKNRGLKVSGENLELTY